MDRYLVVGNPIAHSKSPLIHSLFAQQTQQQMHYDRLLIEPGEFNEDVRQQLAAGCLGLNVTLPFKQDAFTLADSLSEAARQAGAVNTLSLSDDNRLLGHNTDGIGLVMALRQLHGWQICGRKVLIIGAGGAVRGVLGPLLAEAPSLLTIVNRSEAKAEQLAETFASPTVSSAGFQSLGADVYDLVINGTSASLSGTLPDLPSSVIGPYTCVYDMVYGDEPTVFLRWAESCGAVSVADGLSMLVGQAAESFHIWRGVRPEIQPVVNALRRHAD